MATDLVAVVGEYEKDGQQKAEFIKIGVILKSQNNKPYALLDPAVDLAGVLAKQNVLAASRGENMRSMVMTSLNNKDHSQAAPQQSPNDQSGYAQSQPSAGAQRTAASHSSQPPPAGGFNDGFDDDTPF